MSSRTQQHGRRAPWGWGATLCPVLAVLFATLVMCLGYVAPHDRGELSAAPVVTVSVAQERLGSPAEHDQCCGMPTREARAVLPVGAQPLPAVLPRMPAVARPLAYAHIRVLPPARGAPDLHVLQVQRI